MVVTPALRRFMALAGLAVGTAAAASPIQFSFSGTVTDDAIDGCDAVVACGVVTGSYSFDSASTDGNADPLAGLFAASTISFSIDGTEFFSATNGVINVANDFPQDQ
jgi:hypothetical protein